MTGVSEMLKLVVVLKSKVEWRSAIDLTSNRRKGKQSSGDAVRRAPWR